MIGTAQNLVRVYSTDFTLFCCILVRRVLNEALVRWKCTETEDTTVSWRLAAALHCTVSYCALVVPRLPIHTVMCPNRFVQLPSAQTRRLLHN